MEQNNLSSQKMLQIVGDYEAVLNEMDRIIKNSDVKINFFLTELDLKRTTFYTKRVNLDFSPKEVRKIIEIWKKFGNQ